MEQSNPSIHRKIWTLAGPMMLSNISQPLLGLVDTAVVGHLDSAVYLAAVSVGAMIVHFLYWAFGSIRMSTVGMVAQAYGAKDGNEIRNLFVRASIFVLVLAALLIVLQQVLISVSLQLVQPENDVAVLAREYFSIRIWSAPAALLTYVLLGWFLGLQKPRQVLFIMVFVNVLNILLDFVFVIGFNMQVAGVAFASLIAEYAGVLVAMVLLCQQLKQVSGNFSFAAVFHWQSFRKLAGVNSDIFIRTIALLFAFAFFTTQGARAGDVVVASNTILLQLITFMAFVLDAYAHAAEAMVGQAIGFRDNRKLKNAINACLYWSLGSSLIFSLFYLLAGHLLVNLLTDINEVRQFTYQYLYWLAAMPLIAVWSYHYDGVFVGATWSREMRNVMLLTVCVVYLPVWYMTRSLGNHGLWLALMMFFVARGGLMAVSYRRKINKPEFSAMHY